MSRNIRLLCCFAFALIMSVFVAACSGNAIVITRVDAGASADSGPLRINCEDGVVYTQTSCSGACPAGQVRGVMCNADHTAFENCGCHIVTIADGGVQPQPLECVTGVTRQFACRSCNANQNATQTCVNGFWADCRCVDQAPGGGGCVPNSVTNNMCASCQPGFTARQVCNSAGTGYGPCECAPSPTNQVCTPNFQRVCPSGTEVACGAGFVARQTCSNDGLQWSGCQCVSAGGGNPTVCVPNQDYIGGSCSCGAGQVSHQACNAQGTGYVACTCVNTSTVCSPGALGAPTGCASGFSCGTNQTMRQACNAQGTGYTGDCQCVNSGTVSTFCTPYTLYTTGCTPTNGVACTGSQTAQQSCSIDGSRYNSDCRCTGGGTVNASGAQTAFIQLNASFWRYNNGVSGTEFCSSVNDLNVRCFDGVGAQVVAPQTMSRTVAIRDWKSGIMWCDVICGTAADARVHPLLWDGRLRGQFLSTSNGVQAVSVTGGPSTVRLGNQLNAGRFCAVPHRTNPNSVQIAVAIDDVDLGTCP